MITRGKKVGFVGACVAIAAGAAGELHVHFPALGTIAMLDLVAYFIAVPVILRYWGEMGTYMRRSLIWALAWMVAAMLANYLNYVDFRFWVKCVTVVASSWAIMAAAYLLLKDRPMNYIWYLVGTGIGGWVALYYFRNGALESFATGGDFGAGGYGTELLLEKQVLPFVVRGIFLGILLSILILVKRIPIFIIAIAALSCGFYLLLNGGSRSSFGVFCGAGAVGLVVACARRAYQRLGRHSFSAMLILLIGVCIVFGGYRYMASSGMMGENEADKYELEFGKHGTGVIEGRAGFGAAIENALDSYGIGKGWCLRNHSVMANSLSCEGVVGFLFWVYFYWVCFWFVCKRIPYSGKYSVFIMLMILTAAWDVFGSPFGTRHKFFVLMTFIALCRDDEFYGSGNLFNERFI